VNEGGLLELHFLGVLPALAEVGVLINGAGNKTGDRGDLLFVGTENLGETGREGSGRLDGAEVELADVVAVVESEGAANLVDRNALCHAADVLVESATNEVEITENKSLLHVKSDSNNIPCVRLGVSLGILDFNLRGVHVLLVVGHHDDEGHIKNVLQPPIQ